jgi:hypothetical protein
MHQPIQPTVGRTVLFVLPDSSKRAGEIRPATVVRVNAPERPDTTCNLIVHLDGPNDQGEAAWRGSVAYDDTARPGTWHWMPYQLQVAAPR